MLKYWSEPFKLTLYRWSFVNIPHRRLINKLTDILLTHQLLHSSNAGVQAKSSYITDAVGAKVISLGSIFKKDTGNGIIDHKDVDPTLGSIEQVDAMLASFKKSGNTNYTSL